MRPTDVTDQAVSTACIDEWMGQSEVGAVAGAAPLGRPCVAAPEQWWPNPGADPVASFSGVGVSYGGTPAVRDVSFAVPQGSIVALIGPSGSGKSSLIRCLNRMNDLVPGARVDGDVRYRGVDLYGPDVDAVSVRKRNAFGLSGGQQQRLVIARCLAVDPDVLLMDEPASALDPLSTARIEELMRELTPDLTIVIVTHNLQQAGRVANFTAFLTAEADASGGIVGRLVEFGSTERMFTNPEDARTEAYPSGSFG